MPFYTAFYMRNFFKKISVAQGMILAFMSVILLGSFLLSLPVSSVSGEWTGYGDALFTSVSATCVTGLVVVDTAAHWSVFGQMVILLLIQIGGLGVITIAIGVTTWTKHKIGLHERTAVRDSLAATQIGGVVRLMRFIVTVTFVIELIGALILSIAFIPKFGFFKGLWYGIFHSVSSFCNAGFDVLGGKGNEYASLTAYAANPLVNITVMFLIVSGGIGFLTWDDVRKHKWRLREYRLQSKIILSATAILIILPALWFFFFDFSGESAGKRVLLSLFQAITPRTAGSNTADLTKMKSSSQFLMMLLMLVGGASGSTAGGIKINTVTVLFIAMLSIFKRNKDVTVFRRRISDGIIRRAAAVAALYITLWVIGGVTISAIENLPVFDCLFETASAIGTVGLTLGLTPTLGAASRTILAIFMFVGRMGGITFAFATIIRKNDPSARLPEEKINVG